MPIHPNLELLGEEKAKINSIKNNVSRKEIVLIDIKQLTKEAEEAKNLQNYTKAIYLYKKILLLENKQIIRYEKSARNKISWSEHPARLTLINLAHVYRKIKLYKKAKNLYLRVLSIDKKALGHENLYTAGTLNNLAGLYYEQRLFSKAEQLYLRALSIDEKVLGSEHPYTAISRNNLALLYFDQILYSKAEPLLLRNLSIQEKKPESEHSDIAGTLNNLAKLYIEQGLYNKAEPLLLKALSIDEKISGSEHPDTASSLNSLALLYNSQGLYSKAEPLLLRALSIDEKVLGPEHPNTAGTLNLLADIYFEQGLYSEAEPLLLRALSIDEKVSGPEHPDTAGTLNFLADLYIEQGLYSEAEPLFLRSLSITEKVLGPDHLDTAVTINGLAKLYFEQGLYSKAEPLFLRSLSITEKVLGPGHHATIYPRNNLASIYRNFGLYSKAEPLFLRSLSIAEKIFGPEHPTTATSINNLALLYNSQGLYSKAEPLFLRTLSIVEKNLGTEHPYTAGSLNNLALLYSDQGLYNKAEPLLIRTLTIDEKVLGPEHPDTANSLHNLALLYFEQGLYSKAESLYMRALSIQEKVLGSEHFHTAKTLNNLAVNYAFQGLYEKALPLILRSQKIQISFIQRETPYLPLTDREVFIKQFESSYLRTFDFAIKGDSGIELALYSRLNRHGLLEEIESRQAKLSKLKSPQKQIAKDLKGLIQKLASSVLKDKERRDLIKRKEELEKKLYRLLPALKPRLITVKKVAKSIPRNSILIEFQRYKAFESAKSTNEKGIQHYMALVLKNNGEKSVVNLGLADNIDKTIQQALKASEEGLADAQQLWNKVSELVIHPLADSIGNAKKLFISPDAELNRIPFAALSSPKDNQLLGDALKIRLLTTGRELIDLAKETKSRTQKPLVVANPSFNLVKNNLTEREPYVIARNQSQQRSGDLGSFNWDPLPGTAKEGKIVAELTKAKLLIKDKATSLALQEKEAPKILHIASHAYYLPKKEKGENPLLRSGIVLAGANYPEANPKDDGYLTALEVTKVDWQGTELVVISACESGKGDIESGEGVYGLKRAITVAGARSSLLSLWKVNDNATAAFMESFYIKLRNKQGRADALEATQKEFRMHPIRAWRHPNVWAAFQLSGDWRPIDF